MAKIQVKFNGKTEEEFLRFYANIFQDSSRVYIGKGYYEIDSLSPNPYYSPYDYQKEAVQFCLNKKSALLRLPCGGGKTLIGILTYLKARQQNIITGPGLAVVKASLKTQWAKEIERFSYIKPQVLKTKSEIASKIKSKKKHKTNEDIQRENDLINERFLAQFDQIDFFVTNYEALSNEDIKKMLHKIKPQFVLSDESHYIKNYKSDRSSALYEFNDAIIKIGSTATPFQKDWNDLYGIFHFIAPHLWKDYSSFVIRYGYWGGYGRAVIKNTRAIRNAIAPYVFLKTEEEIGSQLPTLMPPIVLKCTLDPNIQEKSDEILQELEAAREKVKLLESRIHTKENEEAIEELTKLIFMLQAFAQELIDAPELLLQSENGKKYVPKKYINTKLALLLDKVESILDSGEKVCIFSYYEQIQDILEKALMKRFKHIKIAKASGKVKGESRYEAVYTQFRDNADYKILLATDALAEGINLTTCKYIIEYDLAKSYAVQTQRHGRIRRSDSIHKNVYVYQIIAHNSYDEIAQKIVAKKEKGHYESQ